MTDHPPSPMTTDSAEAALDAGLAAAFGPESTGTYRSRTPIGEAVGTVIAGKYKLVERIGEGGMGTVWMAQQTEPVKRHVAVKLIKSGMDSKQVLARFEAERQALAVMDHPNIAKILDGGVVENGSPYFIMELVKGVPITKYCDEHKLTPRQRLELFVPVCQAIQHAHQKGIIHRDIKPSNVMIALYDDKPVPKVIDFGVAKATGQSLTGHTLNTGFGGIIGTPEYMSPEQASLNNVDIDTRSDIYSLGVLLYELLAGSPPFKRKELEQAGLLEILRVIREEEPPKPSTKLSTADALPSLSANRGMEPRKLTGILRNELDWIVMKALEKDRARRYETANGFAADINRYLTGEPVNAHPPSATYRLKKFLRKNKGPVVAVSAVAAALIIGMAGFAWQARVAQGERDIAQDERNRVEREQENTAAVLTFLTDDLLKQADPWGQLAASRAAGRPTSEHRHDPTVRELLDRAATRVTPQAINKQLPNRPQVQAAILQAIGEAYQGVGAYDAAVHHLLRARDALLAVGEESRAQQMTPKLAKALLHCGKANDAVTEHEKLRAAYQSRGQGDSIDALINDAGLALAFGQAGRRDDSVKLFEAIREPMALKLGPESLATLAMLSNLATALKEAGRGQEAIQLFEKVADVQTRRYGAEDPDTQSTLSNLAGCHRKAGRFAEAIAIHEKVLKAAEKSLGPNHPHVWIVQSSLADDYLQSGRTNDAIESWQKILPLERTALGADHPNTLTTLHNLAVGHTKMADYPTALRLYEEALAAKKRKHGEEHPGTVLTMNNYGACLRLAGRNDDAIQILEKVRTIHAKTLPPEHPDVLLNLNSLAVAQGTVGRFAEAAKFQEQIFDITQRTQGDDHPQTVNALSNLGVNYIALGRYPDAVRTLEKALQGAIKIYGETHESTVTTMHNLGSALMFSDRHVECEKQLIPAVAGAEKSLGRNHPLTLQITGNLAEAKGFNGKKAEAIRILIDARERAVKHLSPDDLQVFGLSTRLALNYRDVGRVSEAIKELEEIEPRLDKANPMLAAQARLELGTTYRMAGRWDDAIHMGEKAHDALVKLLGIENPETLRNLNSLGVSYRTAGRAQDAVRAFEQSVEGYTKKLGANHLTTLNSRENLGVGYTDIGRFDEAITILRAALAELVSNGGSDKRQAIAGRFQLGTTLMRAGKVEEAVTELTSVVKYATALNGPNDAYSLMTRDRLTAAQLAAKQFADAEAIVRETMARREKLAPKAWEQDWSRSLLAGALLGQGKSSDALPLLHQSIDGLKEKKEKVYPCFYPQYKRETLERLVLAHEHLGNTAEAEKWRKELTPQEK